MEDRSSMSIIGTVVRGNGRANPCTFANIPSTLKVAVSWSLNERGDKGIRVKSCILLPLFLGVVPSPYSIPVNIPQILTLNPEVALKGLVGGVHGGPLDLLGRAKLPQRNGRAVPRPAVEVHTFYS